MSHQTGIRANEELRKFFGKCRSGNIRVFKVDIVNEELSLTDFHEAVGSWEEDYDRMVTPLVEDEVPCYILYRLDSKNSSGYEWLLISWSPDNSAVRLKMLYASTKATLKQEFGSGQIKEEIHGTTSEDVTLRGFRKHKRDAIAPAPLTSAEEELAELKRSEVSIGTSIDTRHQTMSGIAFPVTEEAWKAIESLAYKHCNYVQLRIDIDEERIHLTDKASISMDQLPRKVPADCARYHLYTFKHTHEGDYMEALVFIYSMPGYSCSIKERMLYSSCKAPLIEGIEAHLGFPITKS